MQLDARVRRLNEKRLGSNLYFGRCIAWFARFDDVSSPLTAL